MMRSIKFVVNTAIACIAPVLVSTGIYAQAVTSSDGPRIASEILSGRGVTDTIELNHLTAPAAVLRDARIFDAGLTVAGDPGATPQARVYAFRTLIAQLNPTRQLRYSDLAGSMTSASCIGQSGSPHDVFFLGTPLPGDAETRVRTLARAVAADSTQPNPVRHAAACAALYQLVSKTPSQAYAEVVSNVDISLEYVCGNQFRLRNPFDEPVLLTYEVEGTQENGTLSLPARSAGTPYSEITFVTTNSGVVKLFESGELVQSETNGGLSCP